MEGDGGTWKEQGVVLLCRTRVKEKKKEAKTNFLFFFFFSFFFSPFFPHFRTGFLVLNQRSCEPAITPLNPKPESKPFFVCVRERERENPNQTLSVRLVYESDEMR